MRYIFKHVYVHNTSNIMPQCIIYRKINGARFDTMILNMLVHMCRTLYKCFCPKFKPLNPNNEERIANPININVEELR